MSDPRTARTDRTRSGPDAHSRRRLRTRRWAVAVARAVLIAVGLVTAYYLLPLDERGPAGACSWPSERSGAAHRPVPSLRQLPHLHDTQSQ